MWWSVPFEGLHEGWASLRGCSAEELELICLGHRGRCPGDYLNYWGGTSAGREFLLCDLT